MLWIAAAIANCIVYLAAVSLLGMEPARFRVTLPAADA